MAKTAVVAGACALALLVASAARAATDQDIVEIKAELARLKAGYEARINALEERLKEAEKRATSPAPVAPAQPAASVPPTVAAAPTASSNAGFNPGISAVLQGRYANLSQDPNRYRLHGFAAGGEIGPGKRGASISESELALFANVDDRFFGNLVFALTPENEVSVEEAYGVYLAAPYGLVPKFGRFFSGLGYLNEQHQHVWDFIDAPLAYEAFLGGKYVNDGLQLKWVAPTDQFLEFGAEVGRGDAFPGTDRNRNGVGSVVLYAHTGGDVGTSHSWRAGLSWLRTRAEDRPYEVTDLAGNDVESSFTGRSDIAVADFVWKYAPGGNARESNFKLQGEYFWRRERGDFTYDAQGGFGLTSTAPYRSTQRGYYLQGVWQFQPQWRIGARYDRLDPGSVDYGDNAAYVEGTTFKPQRTSAMLDWTPSEFSRLRLQYGRARLAPDVTDDQWFLQYILTLGAHPAHRF